MIAGTCKVYADRPAFGFSEDGSDKWRTMRYRELWENVEALAAGECDSLHHFLDRLTLQTASMR